MFNWAVAMRFALVGSVRGSPSNWMIANECCFSPRFEMVKVWRPAWSIRLAHGSTAYEVSQTGIIPACACPIARGGDVLTTLDFPPPAVPAPAIPTPGVALGAGPDPHDRHAPRTSARQSAATVTPVRDRWRAVMRPVCRFPVCGLPVCGLDAG